MAECRRSVKPLQRNTVGSNPTFPTELVDWITQFLSTDCVASHDEWSVVDGWCNSTRNHAQGVLIGQIWVGKP